MIVWGGVAPNTEGPRLFSGGRLESRDPHVETTSCPADQGLSGFSAGAWTGTELIVWSRPIVGQRAARAGWLRTHCTDAWR